jgi:hypothetical protein
VLSIDKKNLAKSIQSQYGNIDTNNYLRRFIDLEFDLKNPSIDKFCDVLCQKFELNNILNNTNTKKYSKNILCRMTLKIIRNLVKICSTCLNDSLKLAASVFIAK